MNVLSQGGYQFYVLYCFLVVFLGLYIFIFCTFYSIHLLALYIFLYYTSSYSIHLLIFFISYFFFLRHVQHLLYLQFSTYLSKFWLILCQPGLRFSSSGSCAVGQQPIFGVLSPQVREKCFTLFFTTYHCKPYLVVLLLDWSR